VKKKEISANYPAQLFLSLSSYARRAHFLRWPLVMVYDRGYSHTRKITEGLPNLCHAQLEPCCSFWADCKVVLGTFRRTRQTQLSLFRISFARKYSASRTLPCKSDTLMTMELYGIKEHLRPARTRPSGCILVSCVSFV